MTGPYNRAPRLDVPDHQYVAGDILAVDGHRWIIRSIHPDGTVTLDASDAGIRWNTTLALLPPKGTR